MRAGGVHLNIYACCGPLKRLGLSQCSARFHHRSVASDQCTIDCGLPNPHLGNAPERNGRGRHGAETLPEPMSLAGERRHKSLLPSCSRSTSWVCDRWPDVTRVNLAHSPPPEPRHTHLA